VRMYDLRRDHRDVVLRARYVEMTRSSAAPRTALALVRAFRRLSRRRAFRIRSWGGVAWRPRARRRFRRRERARGALREPASAVEPALDEMGRGALGARR